jgi:hypothetical protein
MWDPVAASREFSQWSAQNRRVLTHEAEQEAMAKRKREDVAREEQRRAQLARDQAAAELAAQAARERAIHEALRSALAQAEGEAYVDGARQLLERHARRHGVAVGYIGTMGARSGFAVTKRKLVMMAPPVDANGIAELSHEISHNIIPPCPKTSPHLEVWDVSKTRVAKRCLECELLCWEHAYTLIPFTQAMRSFARECLATYERGPASQAAHRAARRFISGAAEREEQQRRLDHQLRLDKISELDGFVRELEREHQPRRLAQLRRQRQIEDINLAAKEAADARTI